MIGYDSEVFREEMHYKLNYFCLKAQW